VINGAHVIINSQDAEADRAFFRDVLGFAHVDAGHGRPASPSGGAGETGWLIFALPPAELALHPAPEASHQLYFMCDDVVSTVDRLAAAGVQILTPITEQRWGLVTTIALPSGAEVGLYEPRHPRATDL
jgi:predicted enzyme related to lactoylglutathione lyase